MTDLQVRYQANQETIRHNLAMETIQGKQADASVRQAAVSERLADYQGQMLPYQKMQAITKSFADVVGAIGKVASLFV